MKLKYYLIPVLSSVMLLFLLVPFGRFGGHHIKFSLAIIGYAILTFLLHKYLKNKISFISIPILAILPIVVLFGAIYLPNFESGLSTIPSSLAHIAGIMIGSLIYKFSGNRLQAVSIAVFVLVCSLWISFKGYGYWLNYRNYGSFTTSVAEGRPILSLYDEYGQIKPSNFFSGKIIVLDFWNTSCGVCFEKFPLVQASCFKYASNPKIAVFSVNIPIKSDKPGEAIKVFKEQGLKIPALYAKNRNMEKLLNITAYPTVLILDQKQNIVYRGGIEGIDAKIAELLNKVD